MLILAVLLTAFFTLGTASAATINLLDLFDRDGSGVVELGDGYPGGTDLTKDNLGLGTIERTFDLTEQPVSGSAFSITITSNGVDFSDNYLTLNGMTFALRNGTRIYTADTALLTQVANTALIDLGGSTSNYEDFDITFFELSYESNGGYGGDAVPEPATFLLFGLGLAGMAGITRKKQ